MSWAANDPEGYNEVLIDGVTDMFFDSIKDNGFVEDSDAPEHYARDVLTSLAYTLQNDCPKAFCELVTWASKHVSAAEADRFVKRYSRD